MRRAKAAPGQSVSSSAGTSDASRIELEDRTLAAVHRAGAFVFRHGRRFYGFEGLRQYQQKFGPEWTPRYLA